MKLVLEGVKIVNDPYVISDGLVHHMRRSDKWRSSYVNSVDEALRATAPWRGWTSCKRYHMISNLARPQVL